MPIAGGTARLLRLAGVNVPVEPARALLVLVRAMHGAEPLHGAADGPRLAPYLDAIARLGNSLSATGQANAREALIDACGFVRDGSAIRPGSAGSQRRRRQLLRDAGFPVDRWMDALGRGETVAARVDLDDVPTLLPRMVWERAVFGRTIAAASLAGAILDDRRAALLYAGLFSLDDETLAFLARTPSLVSAIHRQHAAPFAAFAESIVVHNGQAMFPGGERARSLWEALAGAPCDAPERFLPGLLGRDEGRLAWLFDAVSHADPARQAFALGLATASPEVRLAHARRLYATFAGFQRSEWSIQARPFMKPSIDPAFALQQIAATPDGRMGAPRSRRLWEAAFGGHPGESPPREEDDEVQAAWLLEQISRGTAASRRARLNGVLFAQRLAAQTAGGTAGPAPAAEPLAACLAALPTHQMLVTALERLALTDPHDCVRAVRMAEALTAGDARGASLRLAMFQCALALLGRAFDRGALDVGATRRLARDLFALTPEPAAYARAIAGWLETGLIAALPPRQAPPRGGSIESRLLDGLAGVTSGRDMPIVEWEDHRYRVDPAAADRLRLQRIRARQGGTTLDGALAMARTSRQWRRRTRWRPHVARLRRGHRRPGLVGGARRGSRAPPRPRGRRDPRAGRPVGIAGLGADRHGDSGQGFDPRSRECARHVLASADHAGPAAEGAHRGRDRHPGIRRIRGLAEPASSHRRRP